MPFELKSVKVPKPCPFQQYLIEIQLKILSSESAINHIDTLVSGEKIALFATHY